MKRLLIPVLALCAATTAGAQDVENGAKIYRTHCATCHGIDAMGDGPMAGALLLRPPNLRALTARNDGVFPVKRVVMRIDGRDPLVCHGSPMPVYGDFFAVDDAPLTAETGQPIMTSTPVIDLVAFLQGLQES